MAYIALSIDTPIESELAHLSALRRAGAPKRLAIASSCTQSAQRMSLAGLKRRESSEQAISKKLSRALLGFQPDFVLLGTPEDWVMSDPFQLAEDMHPFFENLGITYYVTGGVAASCHGEPRSTLDLDLVIEIEREDLDLLGAALEEAGFYVPPINVPPLSLENVAKGTEDTLCVTHQTKCVKVDIIVSKDTTFDVTKIQRRECIDEMFYVCSAEDTILQKLRWGALSRSEKQWRDVQAILRIQAERLDMQYLQDWAATLGCSDLLGTALAESGMEGDRP